MKIDGLRQSAFISPWSLSSSLLRVKYFYNQLIIMTTPKSVVATLLSCFALSLGATVEIPPAYYNGSVSVESISIPGNLDGFKIATSANRTSYDFWYFDAFSNSDDSALVINFWNTGGYPFYLNVQNPLITDIAGTFSNGTHLTSKSSPQMVLLSALAQKKFEGKAIINKQLLIL